MTTSHSSAYHPLMYKNRKIVVVMPAYNAAKTLERTHAEVLQEEIVDLIIVVDDASRDETPASPKRSPKPKSAPIRSMPATVPIRRPATPPPSPQAQTSSS